MNAQKLIPSYTGKIHSCLRGFVFSQNHIKDSIFFGKFPIVTIFPFPPSSPYRDTPVDVSIRSKFVQDSILNALKGAILKVNNITVPTNWIQSTTLPEFNLLWLAYSTVREYWEEFCRNEIPELCKKIESRNFWSITKNDTTKFLDMSVEQSIWILHHQLLDKQENIELISHIRDSIIPWLQPELYHKMKQSETRQNTMFNQQRDAMLAGQFDADGIDIIE